MPLSTYDHVSFFSIKGTPIGLFSDALLPILLLICENIFKIIWFHWQKGEIRRTLTESVVLISDHVLSVGENLCKLPLE